MIGGGALIALMIAIFLHSESILNKQKVKDCSEIAPWTGRFYSLLDPSYAKNNIPIIASVSEHQPTAWSSFYFDLQFLVFTFPVGLYFCFKSLTDQNIFAILYGLTSIYFAGVMVRLMLVLAPIACVLGGIAVNGTLSAFVKNIDVNSSITGGESGKEKIGSAAANTKASSKEASSKSAKRHKEDNYPYKSEVSAHSSASFGLPQTAHF